ncbi:MAG TPA: metalloregulator ArsR/SmtB family transcription factor [Tepidisphaeraceae bacterium]|jgi:rhodanese-related sulfurtransferase
MNKAEFKSALFGEFARIGKALGNPHRLQLIELLAQGERSVEELSEELGQPMANVSQHLQVLRGAQLVSVRRSGTFSYYCLADEQVFAVWRNIRDLGTSRLAEVDRLVADYLGRRDELEVVSVAELRRRLGDPATLVLDVRPRREYDAGHIRGARNIPIPELKKRLSDVPKGSEIVAYCRGPYCVFAHEAVAALRSAGFRAARLESGFPDWKARGLPAEVGAAQ